MPQAGTAGGSSRPCLARSAAPAFLADGPIRFTRAGGLMLLVRFLEAVGIPTEHLLARAGLSPGMLQSPDRLVPLQLAYRFAEIARAESGLSNLFTLLADHTCAFDLGGFGAELRRAVTIYDYLKTGVDRIGAWSSGTRFWFTWEGDRLRFNQFTAGPPGAGQALTDLYAVALTLSMLRRFLGRNWRPDEVRLVTGDPDMVGPDGTLYGAPVLLGQPHTSFRLPTELLGRAVPPALRSTRGERRTLGGPATPMPEHFVDSVATTIELLLASGQLEIERVAEVAGLTRRTLQRRLLSHGVSYRYLVNQARARLASGWLTRTELTIAQIAGMLGYRDPANFTRAFRQQMGISPRQFRRPTHQGRP